MYSDFVNRNTLRSYVIISLDFGAAFRYKEYEK